MNVDWNKYGLSDVREPTPEEIEQAHRRGARERAEMFRAVFGGLAAWLGRAPAWTGDRLSGVEHQVSRGTANASRAVVV